MTPGGIVGFTHGAEILGRWSTPADAGRAHEAARRAAPTLRKFDVSLLALSAPGGLRHYREGIRPTLKGRVRPPEGLARRREAAADGTIASALTASANGADGIGAGVGCARSLPSPGITFLEHQGRRRRERQGRDVRRLQCAGHAARREGMRTPVFHRRRESGYPHATLATRRNAAFRRLGGANGL